jgi:hypothetical protein
LVLICSERKVLFAGGWFVLREKYWWLISQVNRAPVDRAEVRFYNYKVDSSGAGFGLEVSFMQWMEIGARTDTRLAGT